MRAAGNACELLVYPGFGHGFFNRDKGGEAIHRQTCEAMVAFLTARGF